MLKDYSPNYQPGESSVGDDDSKFYDDDEEDISVQQSETKLKMRMLAVPDNTKQTKAPEVSSHGQSSKTASLKTSDLVFTKTPLQALVNLVNRGRTKSNEDLDLKHYQILKRKKTDVSDTKLGDEEKYISGPHSLLRQPNTWDQVFHTREGEHESSAKTDSQKPFSTLN